MNNTATDITAPSRSPYAWTARDWAVVIVCGVIFGLIYRKWDDIYTIMLTQWKINPAWTTLINGMWFMGGFIPAAIVRKPGACLFGEALAALVEVTVGPYTIDVGDFGPSIYTRAYLGGEAYPIFNMVFLVGVLEGLFPEFVFGWFRYRNWGWWAFFLAGSAGGVAEWFTGIWITHYYVFYSPTTFWWLLVTSIVAVGLIAGTLAWLAGRAWHKHDLNPDLKEAEQNG